MRVQVALLRWETVPQHKAARVTMVTTTQTFSEWTCPTNSPEHALAHTSDLCNVRSLRHISVLSHHPYGRSMHRSTSSRSCWQTRSASELVASLCQAAACRAHTDTLLLFGRTRFHSPQLDPRRDA